MWKSIGAWAGTAGVIIAGFSSGFFTDSQSISNLPPGFSGEFGVSAGSGFITDAGEVEPEVITTIVTTRATFPNTSGVTVGDFDVQNTADDGTAIRYGYVSTASPDATQYQTYYLRTRYFNREIDASAPSDEIIFIWFSLNGVNVGDNITDAKLHINNQQYGASPAGADGYFSTRLDTVVNDYNCLLYPSQNPTPDPCGLDITANNMNAAGSSDPWAPAIASRTSLWKYGIRGGIKGSSYWNDLAGETNYLDVTESLQAYIDRGGQDAIDRGAMFVVYNVSSTWANRHVSAGTHNAVGTSGGNPALAITTSSRRGAKTWGSGKVPICFTFDDNYPIHVDYFTELQPDYKLNWVQYGGRWGYGSGYADSLYTLHSDQIEFIYHSNTHDKWGSQTGSALNANLAHENWVTDANFTVLPDTSSMHSAWPGGTGDAEDRFYGLEAMWKLVQYGYLSGRGTTRGGPLEYTPTRTPVGYSNVLSWDNYTNIYSVYSPNYKTIVDGNSTNADVWEALMDKVDEVYSMRGRGALTLYGHADFDSLDVDKLSRIIDMVESTDYLELKSYTDVVNTLRARGLVDVADVKSMTAAALVESFADSVGSHYQNYSATVQDSSATADGKWTQFNKMWVGPPGGGDEVASLTYGNYNQLAWSSFTETVLDSIALLDVAEFHMDLFDGTTDDITDRLKDRNSDIILLNYIPLWAVADGWASFPAGSYPRKLYDYIDDNDFWLRDWEGKIVLYPSVPGWSLVNFIGAASVNADSLAAFHSRVIRSSGNLAPHTGVFVDTYGVLDYPTWPCATDCQDLIDLDQDGNPYSYDSVEQGLYQDACELFAQKLREYVATPSFLVVSNGAGFYQSTDYADLIDGAMAENVGGGIYPVTKAEWDDLFDHSSYGMSTRILDEPLMLLDWEGDGSAAWSGDAEGAMVALSLIADATAVVSTQPDGVASGRRFWAPADPHSTTHRVNLGAPVDGPYWIGASKDTIYKQFERGFVKCTPVMAYPFKCIVTDTVTTDPRTVFFDTF